MGNRVWNPIGDLTSSESAPILTYKSYSLTTGIAATRYLAGYYDAPAADANLTQASATQVYGSANVSYASHVFLVAAAAGSVDAGSCTIVVSGTSITDAGVRTGGDSETIVADITAMSTDEYFETSKKWIGQVTYTLTPNGAATYNADFNYGLCKYDDLGNRTFTLTDIECVGLGGAADTGFNVELIHHKSTGWTYSAAAFVAGPAAIVDMNTDHNTEINLANTEPFAWKRAGLSTAIAGADSEGFLVRVTTGGANSLDHMDVHVGATV
jgi:hypothetical protein